MGRCDQVLVKLQVTKGLTLVMPGRFVPADLSS